ncbi:MAG: class I SAM-dependent methyltransferase [Sphingobacteriaceae bacterium]|nr:class I SAM-dependent methyltransferase [Sphingobacteriaceae bacterium]
MLNLRKLYYQLSPENRLRARRLYFLPVDLWEQFTGKRPHLSPPRGMIFVGSGDFALQGRLLLDQLIRLGRLQPNESVLDVGSGIGRVAAPLTSYLNKEGSYEGFDIVKSGVAWCNQNIAAKYPNFRFLHIDLKNDLYNLSTELEAKAFIFPYDDERFDLVFLFSVFTHMMPEDVANYLKQIARVLKPGGRCLATFFVLNHDSRQGMMQYDGLKFVHHYGNYALIDPEVKEANIAFDESWLMQAIAAAGLEVAGNWPGYWPGRDKSACEGFQDTLLLRKP